MDSKKLRDSVRQDLAVVISLRMSLDDMPKLKQALEELQQDFQTHAPENFRLHNASDNQIAKIIGYNMVQDSSDLYQVEVKVRICLKRRVMFVHKTHSLPAQIGKFELSKHKVLSVFNFLKELPEKNELTWEK